MESVIDAEARELLRVWCESLGADPDVWREHHTVYEDQAWRHLASYVVSKVKQAEHANKDKP